MPRANWGISARDIDDFDRDSQYKPYTGPIPPNAVYQWRVKLAQYSAATRDKNPQLRAGLELVPRDGFDEDAYAGYWLMAFLPVNEKTAWRYVPFLDAIGVSGTDFERRTITDEDGNIKKIGPWRNEGKTLILAELKTGVDQDNEPRKEIGTFLPADVDAVEDDETDYEEYADDDDEEVPPPRSRKTATPPRRAATRPSARRSRTDDDDGF